MSDQLQIVLLISEQEALRRLSAGIDEQRPNPRIGIAFSKRPKFVGTKEFIGRVEGNRFFVRKRPAFRSSFITVLTGVVEPSGNGCRITAGFPTQSFRVAKIILTVLGVLVFAPFLTAALITLAAWLSGNSDAATISGLMLSVMTPFAAALLGVAALFYGLLTFGKYQRKSEMKAVAEFVRNLFKDVTAAG